MLCLLMIVSLLYTSEAGIFKQTAVARISVLKGYCDGYNNLTAGLEKIVLKTDNTRRTLLNASIVVREPSENVNFNVDIIKCKNKDSPDTCSNFKTMKFKNMCLVLLAKNQVWSPILANTEPVMTCPIRKGEYVVKDGYFDLTKNPFPLDMHSFWKITLKYFDSITKKMTMCYYCEALILPLKNV